MTAAKRARIEQWRRFDPARGVDQPWRDACLAVEQGRRVSKGRDPEPVVKAAGYLRALQSCDDDRERVAQRWPDLHRARLLAEAGGPPAWEVQSWLLAGQGDEQVAGLCGLPARVVAAYEALFFNVRARLSARDWVLSRAIWGGHPLSMTMPDLGVVLRSIGYFGGPLVLEVMLAATLGRPQPAWVAQEAPAGDTTYGERLLLRARLLADALMLPADVGLPDLVRLHQVLQELRADRPAPPATATVAERARRLVEGAELRRPNPVCGQSAAAARA
jgi:hypothetical protein